MTIIKAATNRVITNPIKLGILVNLERDRVETICCIRIQASEVTICTKMRSGIFSREFLRIFHWNKDVTGFEWIVVELIKDGHLLHLVCV